MSTNHNVPHGIQTQSITSTKIVGGVVDETKEEIEQKLKNGDYIQRRESFKDSIGLYKFLLNYEPEAGDTFFGISEDGENFNLTLLIKGDGYEGDLQYQDGYGNTLKEYKNSQELKERLLTMGMSRFESKIMIKTSFGDDISQLTHFLEGYIPQIGDIIEAIDTILGHSQVQMKIREIEGSALVVEKTYSTGLVRLFDDTVEDLKKDLLKGDLIDITFHTTHIS